MNVWTVLVPMRWRFALEDVRRDGASWLQINRYQLVDSQTVDDILIFSAATLQSTIGRHKVKRTSVANPG